MALKSIHRDALTTAPGDDARWAAVVARNSSFDGKFYFSVSTTGVYCRPSCPARRPRRINVSFHDSCAAAEAAGFRACKRCRPREPSLKAQHTAKMAAACRQIESAETPPSLATLARSAGLSPYHFHRLFTAIVGITPKTYALAERQKRVRRALAGTKRVTDAIFDAGFGSGSRFYADSSKVLGMTATRFKNGGMDTGIRFAIRRCLLGHVLVAMSNKGVCAILLGNAPETLVHEIRDLFPNATFEGRDKNFERMMSKVVAHVDAGRGGLDVPLDVQGTAFQHKVWRALTQIPAGKTVTYSDLAAHLGAPKAVRAVASACAANKLAIVIPCHRVVRSDGTLSGYRWGVERKRKLLERERNALPSNKSR